MLMQFARAEEDEYPKQVNATNVTLGDDGLNWMDYYVKIVKNEATDEKEYEYHSNVWAWGIPSSFSNGAKYTFQVGLYNETKLIDWMVIEMTYTSPTSVSWKCTDKFTKDSSTAQTFTNTVDTTNNCNMMTAKSSASFSNGKAYLKGHFNRKFKGDGSDDLELKIGTLSANLQASYPGKQVQEYGKTLTLLDPDFAKRLAAIASTFGVFLAFYI